MPATASPPVRFLGEAAGARSRRAVVEDPAGRVGTGGTTPVGFGAEAEAHRGRGGRGVGGRDSVANEGRWRPPSR